MIIIIIIIIVLLIHERQISLVALISQPCRI